MSRAFLSPTRCEPGTITSPLRRALEGADPSAVRDLSLRGIVEIRGDLDGLASAFGDVLVRLSPRRGFVFPDDDPSDVAAALRARGVLAYDATGALAGIAIASEQVLRRLTDLDLERLPTAGPVARVTAIVRRGEAGWFEVYVQQELGHYVAEAVMDAIAGLENTGSDPWGLTPPASDPGSDPTGQTPPATDPGSDPTGQPPSGEGQAA